MGQISLLLSLNSGMRFCFLNNNYSDLALYLDLTCGDAAAAVLPPSFTIFFGNVMDQLIKDRAVTCRNQSIIKTIIIASHLIQQWVESDTSVTFTGSLCRFKSHSAVNDNTNDDDDLQLI